MNKEYYANNDKIIVSNESGELRELPNYDNYQERLNTENIIEELDSTINFEEYMKNTYPVDEGKDIKISKILLNLIIIFAPILIGGMLKDAGINLPLVYMSSIVMSVPTLASIVLGIGVVLVNGVKAIKKYKTNKMNKRMRLSYEASIDYLKEVKKEKESKLALLEQDNTITNKTPVIGKVTIDNEELLKDIVKEKDFYRKAGFNLYKYYRHYLDGTLHFVLEKENDINNLDRYIDYIEEKGPKLIKNFRHTERY